jgi:hypothetical protein
MKAADLIALATAHGIDVTQAAKQVTRIRSQRATLAPSLFATLHAVGGKNPCTPLPALSASGRPSHVMRRPEWSIAELGLAAQGLDRIPWLAARYTYAGDRRCYWPLHGALTVEAVTMRERLGWSAQLRMHDGNMRFYLCELAALVLDEDAHQPVFHAAPQLFAFYLGIDEEVWTRQVAYRFEALKLRYMGWLQSALQTMQPRIDSEEACA